VNNKGLYWIRLRPFLSAARIPIYGGEKIKLEAIYMNHELEKNFKYHAPKEGQPQRYETIRDVAKGLAQVIAANCPDSRERSLAITKVEESVMWANAAIARNE
jgi:hypothetical protein